MKVLFQPQPFSQEGVFAGTEHRVLKYGYYG